MFNVGSFLYYIETCKSIIIHHGAISIEYQIGLIQLVKIYGTSLKVNGRLFNYKIEILKGNSVNFFLNFCTLNLK